MLPNMRGFYEGNKSNMAAYHQSLKISLLSLVLSKSNLLQLIRKQTTRCIRLSNFKPCTQISRKLCYQTREGFKSSFKTSKLSTLSYLLLFFEVPQTFNPLSPFPPSTNTPHPSPSLSKKNHIRKNLKNSFFTKLFKAPPFACSPCPM